MNHYQSPDTVVEDCDSITKAIRFTMQQISGLRYRVAYYNYTGMPVTVVDRRGLCHELKSLPHQRGLNKSFFVVCSYDVNRHQTVRIDKADVCNSDPSYVAFVDALDVSDRQGFSQDVREHSATVVYEITLKDIQSRDSVYYRNLDIVLTVGHFSRAMYHPYEYNGALYNELNLDPDIKLRDRFGIGITLIDNNGRIGPRYININGRLYRVPAARDSTLRDGVYLRTSERVFGDVGLPPIPEIQYYSIEAYDKACKEDLTLLRLFVSIDSARSLGDMQSARKEELERLAHERKLSDEEFRRQKLEDDRENDKLKRQIEDNNREHERLIKEADRRYTEMDQRRKDLEHQMRMQELETKSRFEQIKHEQNMQKLNAEVDKKQSGDIVDTIKSVGMILTAVAALAATISKLSGKKE